MARSDDIASRYLLAVTRVTPANTNTNTKLMVFVILDRLNYPSSPSLHSSTYVSL